MVADTFVHVVSAAWIGRGTLVVGDQAQHSISVFDSTGSRIKRSGRVGQGPGEFQMIRRVERCLGDSAVVSDFGSERLTVVGDTGFVRFIKLPAPLFSADLVGCVNNVAVFTRMPDELPGKGTQWFPYTVFTLDLVSNTMQWKTALKGTEMTVATKVPAFFERPYGRRALVAAGGNSIMIAQSDEPLVTMIGIDRGSVRLAFDPGPRRRVNESDRAALTEREASELGNPQSIKMLRQVHEEAEWPEHVPPVDRIIADPDAGVWMRRTPTADDSIDTWILVSPAGKRDSLVVDRQSRVLAIARDRVILVREEQDGRQSVVVAYRQ